MSNIISPTFGYTTQVHTTIQKDCTYQVQIVLRELESGIINNEDDVHRLLKDFQVYHHTSSALD